MQSVVTPYSFVVTPYNLLVPDTPFNNPARHAAVKIVKRLRDAGHVAYLAGGCVRDELLGLVPKDYDVATDADPERVRSLFRHSRFVGEAFGVVLVRKRSDHREHSDDIDPQTGKPVIHQIEVATFRSEWGYEDGRRPSAVRFTDAEHDAQRRDFTINGLFENPLIQKSDGNDKGRIIDFVGGVADLKQGILRAIGVPSERFGEDYLRMLRAVRFAARFGFELEAHTRDAIQLHAPKLVDISRERIGAEVLAMLDGPQPVLGIELIESLGLDGAVLDEPVQRGELRTVRGLCMNVKRGGTGGADDTGELGDSGQTAKAGDSTLPEAIWLAAWMLDRHMFRGADALSPEQAAAELSSAVEKLVPAKGGKVLSRWRNAMCLANELRDGLRDVLVTLPIALRWPSLTIAQRKRLLAQPCWRDVASILQALTWMPSCKVLVSTLNQDAATLFEQGVAPDRFLTGDDLIAMSIKPGKQLGYLLEAVYDEQLELRVKTRDQAAAWVKQQPT